MWTGNVWHKICGWDLLLQHVLSLQALLDYYLYFKDSSDLYISSWWLKWHRPLWTPTTIPENGQDLQS